MEAFQMKKTLIIVIGISVIGLIGYFGYQYFFSVKNTEFTVVQETSFENSAYHFNGTWWGFNQSKIARIDDYVFTYYVDNATQIDEVANLSNPNRMVFVMIDESGMATEFASQATGRPGNVVADPLRKLVYYLTIEPTSSEDDGYLCQLVMYTYQFDAGTVELIGQETVIDNSGSYPETINVRLAVTIDDAGNIGVTYSIPNPSYIFSMYVHTYDAITKVWDEKSVLIEGLNHPNFYPELIMRDPDHFLVVAVQDYCHDGECFYQYTRYFLYDEGVWTYDYLADYRNLDIASERANLTAHSEVYLDLDLNYHIITISHLEDDQGESIVDHYTYDEESGAFIKESFTGRYNHIRMVTVGNVYYFVAVDYPNLYILNDTYEIIHQQKVTKGAYIYVCSNNANFFDLLVTTGNSEGFNDIDNLYLRIEKNIQE
jgi:hypothetical protein